MSGLIVRVAALVAHRVAHRGEVDDARDAGEVLEQHPRGLERDLAGGLVVATQPATASTSSSDPFLSTFSSRIRSV